MNYSETMFGKMPSSEAGLLRWIWFFIKPERWVFLLCTLNRLFRAAVFSMQPLVIGIIIDIVESGKIISNPLLPWIWVAVFIGASAIVYAMLYLGVFESRFVDRTYRRMTLFCVNHLMKLPLRWHEQTGSGAQMQRIYNARQSLRELLWMHFLQNSVMVGSFFSIVFSIIVFKVPIYFHFLFLGFILSFIGAVFWIRRNIHIHLTRHNRTLENLSKCVYDYVNSIRTIKNFSLAPFVNTRAHEGECASYAARKPVINTTYNMWTGLNFVGLFWVSLIIICSLWGVQHNTASLGALAALTTFSFKLWTQLESLAETLERFSEYKNSFMRATKLLLSPAEKVDDKNNPAKFPVFWQNLKLSSIYFNYRSNIPVLSGVNMIIPNKKRIALIGRSGSGKSTLIKLIMKQVLPQSGSVCFDDIDLLRISRDEVLANISLVPQDVELFNGNIRENIILDQFDLSEGEYQACLARSYMTELIADLPAGDLTQIGEHGMRLSGGQRQRLGIARALARRSPIIVFDEATSSLDSESEQYIQDAIENSFEDKTLIVIAHRLSTIRNSDLIYVLDDGQIAETGVFDELLKRQGLFYKFWQMQSDGFVG